MKIPLDESRTVLFDATGQATVTFGPQIYGSTWEIDTVTIWTNSTVKQSEFLLYRNSVSPTNYIDGTFKGDRATDAAANITLTYGQNLCALWINGDVGKAAYIHVEGTKETGRN
jgi:hypothetical protein